MAANKSLIDTCIKSEIGASEGSSVEAEKPVPIIEDVKFPPFPGVYEVYLRCGSLKLFSN